MREGRRCGRKDTLVRRRIVPIIIVIAASANSTKVEVELLLWVDVSIHSEGRRYLLFRESVGLTVDKRRTKCHRNKTKRASIVVVMKKK